MTEQVVTTTRGRTVIIVGCGDHVFTPPSQGPVDAEAARTRASRQSTERCEEGLAATYLEDIDQQTLERNWRPDRDLREGLDIIALEPGYVHRELGSEPVTDPAQGWVGAKPVIVEVKTRNSLRQGPPTVAVDVRKVT